MNDKAVATVPDPREAVLLQAIGFDKLSPAQRELGLAIAKQYDLDPLLKHLVMIEGRAYITRDGLLHVAHRSGQLDGIETTDAVVVEGFWRSTCSVYRKDMSRPFTYTGRYPTTGGNAKFAPEMAVKVGEVMALRRAFDVAAPTAEERWDIPEAADVPSLSAAQPSLAERAAAKRTEIEAPVEPGEPGLTDAEFGEARRKAGVTGAVALERAKVMFPGTSPDSLTDAQRFQLLAALTLGAEDVESELDALPVLG